MEEKEEKKFEGKTKIIVPIEDIHCGDCALNIERSVEHVPGVLSAEVNYVLSTATVYYDPHRVEEERIKRAVTKPVTRSRRPWLKEHAHFGRRRGTSFFSSSQGFFSESHGSSNGSN